MTTKQAIRKFLIISTLVTATGFGSVAGANSDASHAPAKSGSASAAPGSGGTQADVDPGAAAAMAREQAISVPEAARRLGTQATLAKEGDRIEKSLGGHSGGHYLDSQGRLVVTSLDPGTDARVKGGDARVQRVDDSAARLDSIKAKLDEQAARGGTGGVQDWYVDVPTNTVVVTVTDGAADPATAAMVNVATAFGASVRVDHKPAAEAPRSASEYLVGGAQIVIASGGTCSVGFNTIDAWNRNVVLTAGHCTKTSGNISRSGYVIGATRTANFPTDDFGTFWNSYPSFWVPSISVAKYNGTYVTVHGWVNGTVGATVCKSGRTTGWTCGTIRALNQTVNYPQGTVYGLVRHDACVEGGDSGGSNITPAGYALGMTSGASTYQSKCLSKSGGANVSWYQPIGEALTANGLRLRVG